MNILVLFLWFLFHEVGKVSGNMYHKEWEKFDFDVTTFSGAAGDKQSFAQSLFLCLSWATSWTTSVHVCYKNPGGDCIVHVAGVYPISSASTTAGWICYSK